MRGKMCDVTVFEPFPHDIFPAFIWEKDNSLLMAMGCEFDPRHLLKKLLCKKK